MTVLFGDLFRGAALFGLGFGLVTLDIGIMFVSAVLLLATTWRWL